MRGIFTVFVLSTLLVFSGCRSESRTPKTSRPTQTPVPSGDMAYFAKQQREIEKRYRLRPDRRWIQAFREVDRFLGNSAAADIRFDFHAPSWVATSEGKKIATLSAYPDFPEWMAALESWARKQDAGAKLHLDNQESKKSSQALSPTKDGKFFPPDLFEALEKLNAEWKSGDRNVSMISRAANVYTLLAVQTFDTEEVAGQISSRALALIALSRALGGDALKSEETLLADQMGYTAHAWNLAERLSPDDPVRLYVTGDEKALAAGADSPAAHPLAAWLRASLLAREGRVEDWAALTSKPFFREPAANLPVLKSVFDLEDFGTLTYFGGKGLECILTEMTQPRDQWRSLFDAAAPLHPETGVFARFDKTLSALPSLSPGPFIDSDLRKAYYSAVFFSTVSTIGFHLMDSLSSPQAFRDFRNYLGKATGDAESAEFLQWFNMLVDVKTGNLDRAKMLHALDRARYLGGEPMLRIYDESKPLFDLEELVHMVLIRRLCKHLDTRPGQCLDFANVAWNELRDPLLAQADYQAWYQRTRGSEPVLRKWFQAYTRNGDSVTSHPINSATPPDPEKLYRDYMKNKPDNWSEARKVVKALEITREYDKAIHVAADWLDRNGPETGFSYIYAHVAIGMMDMHKNEYEKALRAVEPVVGSWVLGPVRIKALSLIRLKRYAQADPLAKKLLVRYPDSVMALMVVGELYLRTGREEAFADLLKAYPYPITSYDWQHKIGKPLLKVYRDDPGGLLRFCKILVDRGFGRIEVGGIADAVSDAGKPRLAVEILSGIPAKSIDRDAIAIRCYEMLKEAEGPERAKKWLVKFVPDIPRSRCSILCYQNGYDNLLWDLYYGKPLDPDNAEFIWLLLAASHLRQGSKNPEHQKALLQHYEQKSSDFNHKLGQYLLGLLPLAKLAPEVTAPWKTVEIGYFMGLKAEMEGRYRDAVRDYRFAVEFSRLRNCEYHSARSALSAIEHREKSVDILEQQARAARGRDERVNPGGPRRRSGQ